MNGAFFLASLGRCSPELTDAVIEAAAAAQSVDIHEELLRIRLKQRCFVALAERVPGAVCLVSGENFPVDGSDQVVRRSPHCRSPFIDRSGMLACGVHVDSPAETHPPVSISPGEPRASLQSGPSPASDECSAPQQRQNNYDYPLPGLAGLSAEVAARPALTEQDHNRFPKGRW